MALRASRFASGRLLAVALVYGVVFWACYIGYASHLGVIGNDFGVFHRAAGEPLDTVYALRERNPFVYPPTTLLWLEPLAWLDSNLGFALWTALSIGAVGWASVRLADRRVALLVLASPVLATTIAMGQFGALVGAMILLAASFKGWRQGVLFGLAATIKPQMLLAAPLILLVRRDWSALLGFGIAAASVVLAQLVLLGPGLWLDWIAALKAFPTAVERAGALAGSVSPAGVASHFHLATWPFLALGVGLTVALLAKRAQVARPVELAALVIIASALLSPYLLVYDLVAMMPFAIQQLLARCNRTGTPGLANFVAPFFGLSLLWLTATLIAPRRSREAAGNRAQSAP